MEDRGHRASLRLPRLVAVKPLPGAENAGKPGYYTIKPGDTLIRIGLEHGQSWKDIARWSNLENPNLIEVGQVVRVVPPPDVDGVLRGSRVQRRGCSRPVARRWWQRRCTTTPVASPGCQPQRRASAPPTKPGTCCRQGRR